MKDNLLPTSANLEQAQPLLGKYLLLSLIRRAFLTNSFANLNQIPERAPPLFLKDLLLDQGPLLFQCRKGRLMNNSASIEEALPMPLMQAHLFPLKQDHLVPQGQVHSMPDRHLLLSLPHKGFISSANLMQAQLVPGSPLLSPLLLLSPYQLDHLGNVQCLTSMV